MKQFILVCVLCWLTGYTQAQRFENVRNEQTSSTGKEMTFYSSAELNRYRFSNSNLNEITTGHLLDMEEEWTTGQIDSFLMLLKESATDVNKLLTTFNCLERTDVNFKFERDSLLFPVMDHYMAAHKDRDLNIPLFIIDYDMSRFIPQKRKQIDSWTSTKSYPSFTKNDLEKENVFCTSFFADTIRNERIYLYWDKKTYLFNTERTITSVQLSYGKDTRELVMGERLDLSSVLTNGALNRIGITITFSDGTMQQKNCSIYLTNKPKKKIHKNTTKAFGDYQGQFETWDHTANFTVLYGCEDRHLNKPFIMVAGWGPYIDDPIAGQFINWQQGWPTTEGELYEQYNQNGFIDSLRFYGYDVVIVRFTPPNASIHKNVEKLKMLINWVNIQKVLAGSREENVILGYSAGSMCVRLTLQQMEKEHLEANGPHPHTKLYVSFDGEHQGANIPLAVQHSVWYLQAIQSPQTNLINQLNIYALFYILNAPLSRELLHYHYTMTGNSSSPGQGESPHRTILKTTHFLANHAKSSHNPGYPAFSRNISISNGMNESRYTSNGVDHFPYPDNFGHKLFEQQNALRRWNVEFNIPGGNSVFRYQHQFFGWHTIMEGKTNAQCLTLDNAPGGMVFTLDNPLTHTIHMMKKAILSGDPHTYNPHTQFCFTPTIFIHDIRNFNAVANGYKMQYSMKDNLLMFQSLDDYDNELHSNYWGYPHLAYPASHYTQVTPFDAVFAWSENTEHNLFNTCSRSNPNNHNEAWVRVSDFTRQHVVKHFIYNEADYMDAYIQNRRYGWNARSNYIYKAEIIVPGEIFAGQEVTQRTDFKPAELLPNSDITFRAEEAIHLLPGFHVQSGATFHAHIVPYHCQFPKNAPTGIATGKSDNYLQEYERQVTYADDSKNDVEKQVLVYPNPSDGTVNLRHTRNKSFAYQVADLSGKMVKAGMSDQKITTFQLPSGIYIIKTQSHDKVENHKVIVR